MNCSEVLYHLGLTQGREITQMAGEVLPLLVEAPYVSAQVDLLRGRKVARVAFEVLPLLVDVPDVQCQVVLPREEAIALVTLEIPPVLVGTPARGVGTLTRLRVSLYTYIH